MLIKTFLYVMALMALSAAGILVLMRVSRADGGPWRPFLGMQASLFCFLLSLSIQELRPEFPLWPEDALGFLGALGVILSSFGLLRFSFAAGPRGIMKNGFRRTISLVHWIAVILCTLSYVLSQIGFRSILILGSLLQFAAIVHLVLTIRLGHLSCRDPLLARILGDAAMVGIPAFPFLIIDPLGSTLSWPLPAALIDNYSLPVFFLIFNGIAAFRLSSWFTRSEPSHPVKPDWSALGLSSRESEVADLLLEGNSAKEIAIALGLSPKTAENHSYNLFRKLGVSSRFAFLSRYANGAKRAAPNSQHPGS